MQMGRPPIAVNDRGIASRDAAFLANGRARIDVTALEHDVQRLIHSEPVVRDAHRPDLVQAQRAAVTQLPGAPVVPDVIPGLDAIQILQRNPEPQGGRHIIIGDTDALALEVCQTGDTGGGIDVEIGPDMPAAQEHLDG